MVTALFASLLYLMLLWRRSDLQHLLPSADVLDRVTYKTICIAFPLLTGMIAAGAYWANRTWGSYWSWDPKETWAAITWLVYAGYLHMRITRGWRGRRAAYFAILGFGVVIFTFLGVTYLLPGLHAYAEEFQGWNRGWNCGLGPTGPGPIPALNDFGNRGVSLDLMSVMSTADPAHCWNHRPLRSSIELRW